MGRPSSEAARRRSLRRRKQFNRTMLKGDMEEKPSGEILRLNQGDTAEKEEKGKMENVRELKLRYLNSFSGLTNANSCNSKSQKKFERLLDDPRFDVFFLSSSQYCSLQTN